MKKVKKAKGEQDRQKIRQRLGELLSQARKFQWRDPLTGAESVLMRVEDLLPPPDDLLVRSIAAPGSSDRQNLKESLEMDPSRVSL